MIEWLAMGGHGFYIWSSYGMLLAALVIELIALRRGRQASLRAAQSLREARDDTPEFSRQARANKAAP